MRKQTCLHNSRENLHQSPISNRLRGKLRIIRHTWTPGMWKSKQAKKAELGKTRIFIPWKIAHNINQSAPPLLPPLARELVYQHAITRKLWSWISVLKSGLRPYFCGQDSTLRGMSPALIMPVALICSMHGKRRIHSLVCFKMSLACQGLQSRAQKPCVVCFSHLLQFHL